MNIKKIKEQLLLQTYLIPFYFLVYMIAFYDPIHKKIWSELDFNKTMVMKTALEIVEILGEPNQFELREGKIMVLDYYDIVYSKKQEIRYKFVRLILLENGATPLLPNNIYYEK